MKRSTIDERTIFERERDALPHCEESHTGEAHHPVVDALRSGFPPAESLSRLAEFYKVFGDETRIRILYALFESELCVCDIAELLEMSVSAISHQLRVLKQSKLVKARRSGKTVFYSLDDDHIHSILDMGIHHLEE
jgi:ArsR family transcriptional regulator